MQKIFYFLATYENQQKLFVKFRGIKMNDLILLILQIEILQKQAGAWQNGN